MPDENGLQLPFLTRNMLEFEHGLTFALRITTQADSITNLTIRGLTREGVFTFRHITSSSGAANTETFRIPDMPIMVSVIDGDGGLIQGGCYVSLTVTTNEDILYQLCSGFVYSQKALSWPIAPNVDIVPNHGKIEWVNSAQPAAGAEASILVPTTERWKILSVYAKLVTDATVANRRVSIAFETTGGQKFYSYTHDNQTASSTVQYTCAKFGHVLDRGLESPMFIPLPEDIWIKGGRTIETLTTNIQAADDHDIMRLNVEKYYEGVAP